MNNLVMAAKENDIESIRIYLEEGIDPNCRKDLYSSTAIMIASGKGNFELVKLLLEYGADTNIDKQPSGENALIDAIYAGSKEIVKCLLDNSADPNSYHNGIAAITHAANKGDANIVRILIEANANVRPKQSRNAASPPVIEAAILGHTDVIRELVFGGVRSKNILAKALEAATKLNHIDTIRYLVEDRSITINTGIFLSGCQHLEVIKYFIGRGLDINISDGDKTALAVAMTTRNTELIQFIISSGAKPQQNMVNLAAANGLLDTLQWLIGSGLDYNMYYWGERPLETAARHGHLNIVEYLVKLDPGSIDSAPDEDIIYVTPLVLAAKGGHIDVAKFLVRNCANINFHCKSDTIFPYSPLYYAVKNNKIELARFLLENGANAELIEFDKSSVIDLMRTRGLENFLQSS